MKRILPIKFVEAISSPMVCYAGDNCLKWPGQREVYKQLQTTENLSMWILFKTKFRPDNIATINMFYDSRTWKIIKFPHCYSTPSWASRKSFLTQLFWRIFLQEVPMSRNEHASIAKSARTNFQFMMIVSPSAKHASRWQKEGQRYCQLLLVRLQRKKTND